MILGVCFTVLAGIRGVDTGRRMRLRDGWEELQRDPRPPVIFLRPFREDRRTISNGPIGPQKGADVPAAAAEGRATIEPQIGSALRAIGPFVAVGQPGEWLAPFGADRLYVDEDDWRSTVALLIENSGAIVIQPDATPSTYSELMFVARHVDPQRILMLVPNPALRPLGFERVRRLAGSLLPVPLPQSCTPCDAFIFDRDWNPRPLLFGRDWRPAFLSRLEPSIGPFLNLTLNWLLFGRDWQASLDEFVRQVRHLPVSREQSDAFSTFIQFVRC